MRRHTVARRSASHTAGPHLHTVLSHSQDSCIHTTSLSCWPCAVQQYRSESITTDAILTCHPYTTLTERMTSRTESSYVRANSCVRTRAKCVRYHCVKLHVQALRRHFITNTNRICPSARCTAKRHKMTLSIEGCAQRFPLQSGAA